MIIWIHSSLYIISLKKRAGFHHWLTNLLILKLCKFAHVAPSLIILVYKLVQQNPKWNKICCWDIIICKAVWPYYSNDCNIRRKCQAVSIYLWPYPIPVGVRQCCSCLVGCMDRVSWWCGLLTASLNSISLGINIKLSTYQLKSKSNTYPLKYRDQIPYL